jgi:tRNA G18 (ribose-2'-O)-methylase SpoU
MSCKVPGSEEVIRVTRDKDDNAHQWDHVLDTAELRHSKPERAAFAERRRNPVTVVLDGVAGHYNIGAIFRLCDAFLVERLVICGTVMALRNRRLVQAAAGTLGWVPWHQENDAAAFVRLTKAAGHWVTVVELTAESVSTAAMQPRFPAVLVLGSEAAGVSREVLACADQAVAIPMLGMANSLNVSTAGAVVLHVLICRCATQ